MNIPESVSAQAAWDLGITGERAVVALFDTGLSRSHPSFKNVLGVINFTTETTEEDPHGHGTFVAGVESAPFFVLLCCLCETVLLSHIL